MKLTIDTRWIDAFSEYDDTVRLAMYDAMFNYLEGKKPLLSGELMMVFNVLKPFLDEETNKRIRLAERSRENGKKGGRKPNGTEKPVQKKVQDKHSSFEKYLEQDEFKERSESLLALDKWKKDNVPYIYNNIRPLKQKEFDKLNQKYGISDICKKLMQIENRKDLRRRYSNLYLTLNNWLKNGYS